jgi:hypothetical protein
MRMIQGILMLILLLGQNLFAQEEEPLTKELLREYYPILMSLTDQDPGLQDDFFRFYEKRTNYDIGTDEQVAAIFASRDTLIPKLTPLVRQWLRDHYDEELEEFFNIKMELQPNLMDPILDSDTLYALFQWNVDYVLETRSTTDYWMYLQFRQQQQYLNLARKKPSDADFLGTFFDVVNAYLELKGSNPESPYLAKMRPDYEYALGKCFDIHILATSEISFVLMSDAGTDLNQGKTAVDYLYTLADAYTPLANMIDEQSQNTSIIQVDENFEFKQLYILSVGSFPDRAAAEKARIKYLENEKLIPHVLKLKTGKSTAYYNVYRYYTDAALAQGWLKTLKTTFPGAVMLKADAKGNILK